MPGPTCPVSPSMACLPHRMILNSPNFLIARARVYAVAQESEPEKARSESWIASFAPIPTASLSALMDCGGPSEITVTLPPNFSLRRRASSIAYMSKGLIILDIPSRINVLVSGLILTSVVSGTCLMQTIIFN